MTYFTEKTPVNFIPKVGPKFQSELEKLNILTVGDLLHHIPFRYDDYSNVKKIIDTMVGEVVSIKGVLTKPINIISKTGKRLTICQITDGTEKITLIWFNQQYLQNVLRGGKTYAVSGKVSSYNGKKCIFTPEVEEGEGGNIIGRLVGVYPSSLKVTSRFLRSRINDVIANTKLEEFLPDKVVNKYKFPSFQNAIKSIHFPSEIEETIIAKKRLAYNEVILEMLSVARKKKDWISQKNGICIKITEFKDSISELTQSLPFTLTPSQITSLNEIYSDFSSEYPMNRLLEGDVGSGKTIVAIIASYVAYLNGYKTLFMAPTEILANQHLLTFKKVFSKLHKALPNIGYFAAGKNTALDFDIAIGTHALLYLENPIKNLGLLVIDEQHRFGVEQRSQLQKLSAENLTPNLLSMTATPIPRTLALTLYGDLNISTLSPHIQKGRKVTTKVLPQSARDKLYNWIKEQSKPTFIVCPFIEESENVELENVKAAEIEYRNMKKIVPEKEVALIHGRMSSVQKTKVVEQFKSGKIKYLVSTPVVEVGIDIPDATIMVIESAERYGLASLHQLRGRVGRKGEDAFCFLFYSEKSRGSLERLKYMESITSGLELAEIDLKLRGQGDIYGTMQSGVKTFRIANVYDVELLKEARDDAESILPSLKDYPLLEERLKQRTENVVNN